MKKIILLCVFCFLNNAISLLAQENSWLQYAESESLHSLPDHPIRVQVANYVFRKFDAKRRILAFTQSDADVLRQFFLSKKGVLACETHTLDKSIKVLTRADGDGFGGLNHQQLIEELSTMGYVPASYKSGFQELFLATRHHHESPEKKCADCLEVKVSEELRKKFENMDYGDKQIDFGGDSDMEEEIDTIPKTEVMSKPNE